VKRLCRDGRLARPSGAKLRPLCPGTNLAKFLHLQALSGRIYPGIIPRSGPPGGGEFGSQLRAPARKWNSVIAPAAKRRHGKARHVSAGKRVAKGESRGVCVATPSAGRKWNTRSPEPRSGGIGKPGTSVPGNELKKASPGGGLCRNPERRKKVEHAVARAAKRRNRKARHVSAGKQMWDKVESQRDGTLVATQTPEGRHTGYDFFHALRRVSNVISGGTPIRTGKPRVPSPRFT
jgi:hypothetical protein